MSRGRWGGFKKGRKRVEGGDIIKDNVVFTSLQKFSYIDSEGIWNIKSTTEFSKKPLATPTYLTTIDNNADAATYTFSNVDLSSISENDTLVIIVQYMEASVRTLSNVVISGSPCNLDTTSNTSGENTNFVRIHGRNFGASETIVVSIAGGNTNRCRISLYRVEGYILEPYNSVDIAQSATTSLALSAVDHPGRSISFWGYVSDNVGGTFAWDAQYTLNATSTVYPLNYGANVENGSYAAVGSISSIINNRSININVSNSGNGASHTLRGIVYLPR